MPTAAELQREANQKRGELYALYQKGMLVGQKDPDTGAQLFDPNIMTPAVIDECQKRDKELAELETKIQTARLSEAADEQARKLAAGEELDRKYGGGTSPLILGPNGTPIPNDGVQAKSISEQFIQSKGYQEWRDHKGAPKFKMDLSDVDLKTLMSLSAGFAGANSRSSKIVLSAQRRPMVSDLIPTDTTRADIIKYMEETTFTNNASSVAEGGQKPESALAFTERSSEVKKIATFLPVTEEQLDVDVAGFRNLIDSRLMLMVLLAEEWQLLLGSGGGSDLDGFLHRSGVQAQARGSDNNADAVFKSFTLVRWTGYAEPSGVVMHPTNWETIRLMKTTGSGEYIMGNPMVETEARLFGKPVVITNAITVNTALTGDFVLYSHISRKLGLRIDVSDSHSDWFQYNKLAIRAEMRESLEIYRAAAFCKVTGLN